MTLNIVKGSKTELGNLILTNWYGGQEKITLDSFNAQVDVRDYAAKQGMKAEEFKEQGSEIYQEV